MVEVAVASRTVDDRGTGFRGEVGEVIEVLFGKPIHVGEQPSLGSVVFEPFLERGAISAIVHGAPDTCEELVERAGGLFEHVPFFR